MADTIPCIEQDDNIMTDDLDKAAAFNKFYLWASNLDESKAEVPDSARLFVNGPVLGNIEITLEDVADQIKLLGCSKSYGPDGIPPLLMKQGGDIIISILHRLYSLS